MLRTQHGTIIFFFSSIVNFESDTRILFFHDDSSRLLLIDRPSIYLRIDASSRIDPIDTLPYRSSHRHRHVPSIGMQPIPSLSPSASIRRSRSFFGNDPPYFVNTSNRSPSILPSALSQSSSSASTPSIDRRPSWLSVTRCHVTRSSTSLSTLPGIISI